MTYEGGVREQWPRRCVCEGSAILKALASGREFHEVTMDLLDLSDEWALLALIGGAILAAFVALLRVSPRNYLWKVLCRAGSAAAAVVFVIGLISLIRAHNHIREPRQLQTLKSIALVTLAADTKLVIGKGENVEEEDNPKEAGALAYIQLKDTLEVFNKSAITVLPVESLKSAVSYKSLSFQSQGTRRFGFRHFTLISGDSSLQVLPVDDPDVYRRIVAPLKVDGALVVQVRYQLASDWRGSLPLVTLFTDPYWYGSVRVNAWLFDRDGSLIWRYHDNVQSRARERSRGFNYIIASGSSITAEQSTKLLIDSISESATRLSAVLQQDIKNANGQ